MGELEAGTDQRHLAVGTVDLLDDVAVLELGMGDGIRQRIDPRRRRTGCREPLLPRFRVGLRERLLDDRAHRRFVLDPARPVLEAGILENILASDALQKVQELPFVVHREQDVPALAREEVRRRNTAHRLVTEPALPKAGERIFAHRR